MGAGVDVAAVEAMRTGCEGSCLGSAERMRRRCESSRAGQRVRGGGLPSLVAAGSGRITRCNV